MLKVKRANMRRLPSWLPTIVTTLASFSIAAISIQSYASSFSIAGFELTPYVGVDAGIRHLDFQSGFGRNLFVKKVIQTNLYAGLKLHENFSIEGGWEATPLKNKTLVLQPGDAALGFDLPPVINDGNPEAHAFNWKMDGWHINLVGHTPTISDQYPITFFGSVGIGRKRIVIENKFFAEGDPLQPFPDYVVARYRRTFTAFKPLLRATIGTRYMFNQHFGARLYFGWENTKRFSKLNSKEVPGGVSKASLDNSTFLGLGICYQF